MVCTRLGSLLRPLFYFLCYIHFSLSVEQIPLVRSAILSTKNLPYKQDDLASGIFY